MEMVASPAAITLIIKFVVVAVPANGLLLLWPILKGALLFCIRMSRIGVQQSTYM